MKLNELDIFTTANNELAHVINITEDRTTFIIRGFRYD